MKIINRTIALILCLATLLSVCSCVDTQTGNGKSDDPDINVSIIDGDKEPPLALDEDITDIYSLVCSAVCQNLTDVGFTCGTGVASTMENDNYSALGIYYYDDEIKMFSDDTMTAVGFVEITDDKSEFYAPDKEESMIYVSDVYNETPTTDMICVYNYESIGSYHLVYKGKYVTYYQQTPMRVVYEIHDNEKINYDLSLGSLYDYDANKYLYDESIFGEYQTHSGVELFGKEDYEKLEENLKQLSNQQLANGYIVNEFNIVYISPEAIQAYLLSDEKDTFFGYSVDELSAAFGAGTALTYSENGFSEATIIPDNEYNWKSFLIKCGIGCGIILVGAVLTPVTGGASFGCALLTITKFAAGSAIAEGLGTLAIETVVGLIQGQTIEEALKGASHKGLDAFANGFMIGAAIGSVGVVSGVIKPTACFVADTPIVLANNTLIPIESIKVGDDVLAYNEETGLVSQQRVSDIFCKEVYQTISLTINGEIIETTPNHPFYSPKYKQWVTADSLIVGDYVYCLDGSIEIVEQSIVNNYDSPVKVYNFTVENDHTYFVGKTSVLVHNECTTWQSKKNKGVSEAWKQEKEAVLNRKSKYNWTPSQKSELIKTGKVSGYEGAHIIDANKLRGTARESLVWDPDNIIFLREIRDVSNPANPITRQHLYVHCGSYKNATDTSRIVELLPWAAEKVAKMMAA